MSVRDRSGEAIVEVDARTGERVRIELIRPMTIDELASDEARIRILGALAALRHPNIPRVLGVEFRSGHLALTSELVEGETAGSLITRDPIEGPRTAFSAVISSAFAIDYAMDHGIYHPDLTLDSIVVSSEGELKVLGCGIRQLRDGRVRSPDDTTARRETEDAFERLVFLLPPEQRLR